MMRYTTLDDDSRGESASRNQVRHRRVTNSEEVLEEPFGSRESSGLGTWLRVTTGIDTCGAYSTRMIS